MDNTQNIGSSDWMTKTSQPATTDTNLSATPGPIAPSLDDIRAKIADLGGSAASDTQTQPIIDEFPKASPEASSEPVSVSRPATDALPGTPSEPEAPSAPTTGTSTPDLTEKTDDEKYEDLLNEELTTLLGKQDAPQAEKDEINQKAVEDIENMAITHIMESLPQEKQTELTNLLAGQDNAAISQFFTDNSINLEQTMAKSGLIYKSNIIDSRSVAVN